MAAPSFKGETDNYSALCLLDALVNMWQHRGLITFREGSCLVSEEVTLKLSIESMWVGVLQVMWRRKQSG